MPARAPATSLARHAWFFLLLALANLMWAGQGPAVKLIQNRLGPIAITFLPFYVATLLLIPFLVFERSRKGGAVWPSAADWGRFALAGVFGQIFAQFGATQGSILSTASNYSILNLLIPVITAVLATFMLRERLTPIRVLCLLIGLAGVFILSKSDVAQASFINPKYLAGNLLCLLSSFGSAYYNVYCKGLMKRFTELEILIYSYIVACIVSLPVLLKQEPDCFARLAHFDLKSWVVFIFLAIFMYGVSMLLFFYVLKHISVTVASLSLYLVPFFGVVLAVLLVHEHLTVYSLAGAAVVLTATLLIMRYDPMDE
jgi:drug/metabolite transporter (DMT)-like permease